MTKGPAEIRISFRASSFVIRHSSFLLSRLDLSLSDSRGVPAAAERASFLSDELFAGGLGCGNDLVETRITAQVIPARIEAEIAVCRAVRDRCDNSPTL
jgi:hypothetical protein